MLMIEILVPGEGSVMRHSLNVVPENVVVGSDNIQPLMYCVRESQLHLPHVDLLSCIKFI